jgi:acetyl esterase/lipase
MYHNFNSYYFSICLTLGSIAISPSLCLSGQESNPAKKLVVPGETFTIEGRPAFIFWPTEEKRRQPQPWVMYAPTLPNYPDVHEQWMHQQWVDAGIAIAGIDVGEAYGSPSSQSYMDELYRHLTQERGFASQPCLLGRSRGGLWVSSWAIRNPDCVAGIAGIYPVYDFTTYPKLEKTAPAYGLSVSELAASLGELNPITKAEGLAQAKIPVFIIHGDQDAIVPLDQNSQTLQNAYVRHQASELVDLVVPTGQGHNFWPGFFRCQNLVNFVIERANHAAGLKPLKTSTPSIPIGSVLYRDLTYTEVNGTSLKLDLYRPKAPSLNLPCVVWVHGGGWKQGSKNRCPATWLVNHGYVVVSIDYRLTDTAIWPAQIDDCRSAIRWLRDHAVEYGLDAQRIGVWGGSAGGHLVALLGTTVPPTDEKTSSRVSAVCDWYGPTDLLTMPANVLSEGRKLEDLASSNSAKLLGGSVRDRAELAAQVSALHHVSSDDTPFLIMHGGKDSLVPLEQSERLHKALQAAGVPSQLHVIPDAGHGGKEFQTDTTRAIIRQFFDKTLGSLN